jgi:endonuclease III-like uncharacterized protein
VDEALLNIKSFDFAYTLRKEIVVVDDLSRKFMSSLAHLAKMNGAIIKELRELVRGRIQFEFDHSRILLAMCKFVPP